MLEQSNPIHYGLGVAESVGTTEFNITQDVTGFNVNLRSDPAVTQSTTNIIHSVDLSKSRAGGLYLHIPYCETKCGYCDFYSIPAADQDTDTVVNALVSELVTRTRDCATPIETVFLGGGTPTLLPIDQLRRLLFAVRSAVCNFTIHEFTIEANPATIDDAKAELLAECGVTRVSLGAQSFHPNELAFLERLHTPDDIAPAIASIRRAGITDYNLDLIFGIGGQTPASWRESIRRALDLSPTHVACYGLTYEPGTRLTGQLNLGQITPCDEDVEADMFLAAIDQLAAAGFEQYEISNFARPGHACRHNLIYWNNGPYIGIGPSAAGYVDGRRYKNIPNAQRYAELVRAGKLPEIDTEVIEGESLAIETLMMQLRQIRGIELAAFTDRTGVDLAARASDTLCRLASSGLTETIDGYLRLTRNGLLVANAIIAELAAAITSDRGGMSLPVVKVTGR